MKTKLQYFNKIMTGNMLPIVQKKKMETDIQEYFDWCKSRLKKNTLDETLN